MFRCFGVAAEITPARACIAMALVALMTLNSCDHQEPQMVLTKPITRDTAVTRAYACQIHSRRNVEIHAPERGYLQVVNVKEGQRVKEGDVMFKILPQTHNAELRLAEAQVQEAQQEHETKKRLLKTNEVSEQQVAAAKAKWDQKLAELKLAQTQPKLTIISAPFSGLMGRLRLGIGSLVNTGDVLTTLSDNHEMWVDFDMPEARYAEYSASVPAESMKQVKLILANGRTFAQTGRLDITTAKVNPRTGSIPLRAVFPNPKDLLRHGGTGNIRMENTIKNALLVPQQSTFELQEHRYLYVVDQDHVIRRKQLSITHELDGLFVVTGGVSANDTIILKGLSQAHDGEKAKNYQFEEPAVAYAHLKRRTR